MKLPVHRANRVHGRFTTRSGEKITLRLIKPADAPKLEQLFYALSPESRFRRFHTITDRIGPEEIKSRAKQMANVDNLVEEGAVIALAGSDGDEQIVGVVRLARPPGKPNSPEAETAVVVRDDYHGQGIGAELLRRLVLLARRMKVNKIVAIFQPDNDEAIRLFRRIGLPYKMVATQGTYKMYSEVPD